MKFVVCPNCKRIKFLLKDGSPFWVKLLPEEEAVLDLIVGSDYLILMVGGYDELHECCDECCLIEQN
jgi:hypothetical protein